MNTTTMTTKQPIIRTEPMEALWGAWTKQVVFRPKHGSIDITGIYDNIHKEKKNDFPFTVDLRVIIAFQADKAEIENTYKIKLDLIDRYAINHLFILQKEVTVFDGDVPIRWYESYYFENVEFREPDYYELLVSIDNQFKQRIPLWVTAPKLMMLDLDKDITTEMWPEDSDLFKDKDIGELICTEKKSHNLLSNRETGNHQILR